MAKLTRNQQIYAQELVKATGLDSKTVSAWLLAEESGTAAAQRERSGNNNWLNIGPGRTYATPQEGAAAAAKLLRTSGYYKGIRAAARTDSPAKQAAAIAASPWDAGHYRGGSTLRSLLGEVSPIAMTGVAAASKKAAPASTKASSAVDDALLTALSTRSRNGGLLKNALSQIASGAIQDTPSATPSSAPATSAPTSTAKGGVKSFDGKPVASWIADVLEYARGKGWHGTVTSGVRTDAEQTRIYRSGVRPAAKPKSMGGAGSNHERTGFLQGAVDVTDAPALSKILKAKGSRLQWAGAKDPVHFSVPRNGSY